MFWLMEDGGEATELLAEPAVLAPVGGMVELNQQRVRVDGELVPSSRRGAVALRAHSIQREQGTRAAPAARGVTGSQPWVSLLCKFSNVAAEPRSLDYFRGMYSDVYPGLDHYWRQASYDQINLLGSNAFGWFTLPRPKSYYVYDRTGDGVPDLDWGRAAADCTAVAEPYVYFPNYVGINLMFNDNLDCCAWGVGGWALWLDNRLQSYYLTWEPPWGYGNLTVMAHETGHGFGLPHSAYLNTWDIMSEGWRYCSLASNPTFGCLPQHTITYHKDRVGWIPPALKYRVTSGNQASLVLERLALPQTGSYLMAEIPLPGKGTRYYTVETRRRVGYDVKLPGEAIIIHEVDTARTDPARVLNKLPDAGPGATGAMWNVGDVFRDSANGISVSVDASTATGFLVTIGNEPDPDCSPLFLAVEPGSGGTISADPAPNCNNGTQYTPDTEVTLTLSLKPGYVFVGWQGDGDGSDNPTTITMKGDRAVVAGAKSLTAITLTFWTVPSLTGQPVTVTVRVAGIGEGCGTPTGAVSLWEGPQLLGKAQLDDGEATFSVLESIAGEHSITAFYEGDPEFVASSTAMALFVEDGYLIHMPVIAR